MWLNLFRPTPDHARIVQASAIYRPRATRFELAAHVSFLEHGLAYTGESINVSQSGLLAQFRHPPEIWKTGQLVIETPENCFKLYAKVVRLQGKNVGFAFSRESRDDLNSIATLIHEACDRPLVGPPFLDVQ